MPSSKDDTFNLIQDSKKILSCFEAILQLPNGASALKAFHEKDKMKKKTFSNFILKNHTEFDEDVLPHLKVKLNVVKYNWKKEPILIYDNRFLKIVKPEWPELCWILDKNDNIVKRGDFNLCPRFSVKSSVSNLPREQDLFELLPVKSKFKNPTNLKEVKKIIKKYNLEDCTIVWYHWRITNVSNRFGEVWLQPPPNKRTTLDIEAFLKPDYSIGFRGSTKYLDDLDPIKKSAKEIERESEITLDPPEPLNEFQRNCSASVSVCLTGLNEFFNLSALSLEEWKNTSFSLGKTIAVLWIDLDTEGRARFATYKDFEREFQIELIHQKDWKKLFEVMFEQREKIKEKLSSILQPAVNYLKKCAQNINSPFKRCLSNLETCISNSKVLVYGNDHVMHSVKLQFTHFMFCRKPKGFRGVTLNPDSRNNLVMLKSSEMTIYNFSNYLELEKNLDNFLPPPVISGSIKYLQNQKPQANQQSTYSYVKNRGLQQSQQLFEAWQTFGKMFVDQFQYDIFSLPFLNLPGLSYKAVWTFYTRSGGWYHHGLEKTKPFDKDLLRQHCHGGFSYSAKLKRDAGDLLEENSEERCRNIQGCDIRSSYGYACSELSAVKGFCTSYKCTKENNTLTRCDPVARFKNFEFLSVFYTIHHLETKLEVNIKTVYSNFSQFGIFYVKNFPLDLAIVTTEGNLRLFNMDGAYAHGCREGCPDLRSYVRNKSRRELEDDSQKRDDFIRDWCKEINAKANNENHCTYSIKTNCHDPPYFRKNLDNYFKIFPVLSSLVSHYFYSQEITLDELFFCSDDLTFICLAEGYVPQIELNPLFILSNKNNNWNRAGSTLKNEPLFFTRDYLNWLVREFNFRVTKVHKVWIYKKCKVFNLVFKQMIEKRALSSTSNSQKQHLKNVVNFCAGYLGLNEQKNKTVTKVRLVTQLGKDFDIFNTEVIPQDSIENVSYKILRKTIIKKKGRASVNAALPLYCLITEFGKMRLSQVMCFYERFLVPKKFKFVYSQIDNLILILSTETIEQATKPGLKKKFLAVQSTLFGLSPGQLKEEFEFISSDRWRFVSGMPQNYAILAENNTGIHKNNGLNCISSEKSYSASCDILNKMKVFVQQERRVDKMCNTETVTKTLCYSRHLTSQ